MKTPREEAHVVVEWCPYGPQRPNVGHSRECDRLTELVADARADGVLVGVAAARARQQGMPIDRTETYALSALGITKVALDRRTPDFIATVTGVLLTLLLFAAPARAADPIPFFKPDYYQFFKPDPKPIAKPYGPPRPHRIAIECAFDDRACIRAHDERALDLAILARDRSLCSWAVRASWCTAVYEFIYDDGPVVKREARSADPMLYDPCTFVVSIDSGRATLYSFRLKRWLVVEDQSWERAEFIGECAVEKLPPRLVQGVQTLPGFPWVTRREP